MTQPGNVLRIFERGGRRPLEIGIPDPDEEPGRPKNRLSNRGLGTLNRTDPVFIGLQKTRLLDPTLQLHGHQRSSRRLPLQRLHRLPRRLRQRSLAGALGPVRQGRQPRHEPDHRPDDPEGRVRAIRSSTCSRTSIPTSQCMTCHMHPGHEHGRHLSGATWWDNETDGDKMYPTAGRKLIDARASRDREAQSRRQRAARPVVGPGVPAADRHARVQRAAEADAVRRLPRPRLAVPRRLQARPQGQPARRAGQPGQGRVERRARRGGQLHRPARRRRTSGAVAAARGGARGQAGAPEGHPPRARHAVRRLPLQAGQPRQRQALRRAAQRHRDRLRRLPRHASPRYGDARDQLDAAHDRPGGAGQAAAPTCAALTHAVRDRRASTPAAARVLIQRSMIDEDLQWEVPQVDRHRSRRATPRYNEKARLAQDDAAGRQDAGATATSPATSRTPTSA